MSIFTILTVSPSNQPSWIILDSCDQIIQLFLTQIHLSCKRGTSQTQVGEGCFDNRYGVRGSKKYTYNLFKACLL